MKSLHDNHTWDLVKRPAGSKLVSCKWIFKRKQCIPGVEQGRFKARLVARGFTQREGIDYNDVFSPIVKHRSIRILLSMVAKFDLELEQMDVKTAFLYGELEETIYLRQWNKRFDEFMARIKFKRSKFGNSIFQVCLIS